MELTTIVLIFAVIAVCIQVLFELHRAAIARQFEQKRMDAQNAAWQAIVAGTKAITAAGTAEALIKSTRANLEESKNRWDEANKQIFGKQQEIAAKLEQQNQEYLKRRAYEDARAAAHSQDPELEKRLFPDNSKRPITQDIYYSPIRNIWEDRYGRQVPAPDADDPRMVSLPDAWKNAHRDNPYVRVDIPMGRRQITPDWMGMQLIDPRAVGIGIRTQDDEETEQQSRARIANETAFMDQVQTGLGILRATAEGVEHVPVEQFRGSGGEFDGGGASGDYSSTVSASTDTSSSTDSSSCSSSDSGASSSPSD